MGRLLPAVLLSVAALTCTLPAQAAGRFWDLHPTAGHGYSLDEAVREARRRGKVLSADTVDESGRRVHRIRVLTGEGQVRRYRYDAATGAPVRGDRGRGRAGRHAPRRR